MLRIMAIGLAAGLASALLFMSPYSGATLSLALYCVAALPVMIVALGWSHIAGLVATLSGSLFVALVLSPVSGIVYILDLGLPAWLLAYLAMLGRRGEQGSVAEWFPIGHIAAIASLIAAAVCLAGAVSFGPSYADFDGALRGMVTMFLREVSNTPDGATLTLPDIDNPESFVAVLAAMVPPMFVLIWFAINLFNLWLAARIVRTSSRLARPWPDISATALPRWAAPALAASALLMLAPGYLGLAGELAAAGLGAAFVAVGFAVLHRLTLGMKGRPLILVAVYLACFVMSWLCIGILILGLADFIFDIRGRVAARRAQRHANDNS